MELALNITLQLLSTAAQIVLLALPLRALYLHFKRPGVPFAVLAERYPPAGPEPDPPFFGSLTPGSGMLLSWPPSLDTQVVFTERGMYVTHRSVSALVPWEHLQVDWDFGVWAIVEVAPDGTRFVFDTIFRRRGVLKKIRRLHAQLAD